MTRFARAKGSKASNDRTPSDGTPWAIMKEQLNEAKKQAVESKKQAEAEAKRQENYDNFLNEHKLAKRKSTWCDFPETQTFSKKVKHQEQTSLKNESSKKIKSNKQDTEFKNESENLPVKSTKKKNKKKKNDQINGTNTDPVQNASGGKNRVNNEEINHVNKENSGMPSSIEPTEGHHKNKKKRNRNKNVQTSKNMSAENEVVKMNDHNKHVNLSNEQHTKGGQQKKKKNKFGAGNPVRRKPVDDRSFNLIINGKEIDLIRYDGFPVMKKDAERLDELKKNMIAKGIPKSEIQRTMKLERRRAEKALARVKREVCYNCRKGGHVLSDCPDLKSKIPNADTISEGICFKCGSTEHMQFECKVQRSQDFKFASCFICKEQGHIARQCPDNPKGLYPNGGNCKLCGDVTHLKKDCPMLSQQNEESNVRLNTLGGSEDLEDIGDKPKSQTPQTAKKTKLVKF